MSGWAARAGVPVGIVLLVVSVLLGAAGAGAIEGDERRDRLPRGPTCALRCDRAADGANPVAVDRRPSGARTDAHRAERVTLPVTGVHGAGDFAWLGVALLLAGFGALSTVRHRPDRSTESARTRDAR